MALKLPTFQSRAYNVGDGSAEGIAAAKMKQDLFTPIINEVQRIDQKDSDEISRNAAAESAGNTAKYIEDIRNGKIPEKTGLYDGKAISDAAFDYRKWKTAEARANAVAGRAASAEKRAQDLHKLRMANGGVLPGSKKSKDSEFNQALLENYLYGEEKKKAEEDNALRLGDMPDRVEDLIVKEWANPRPKGEIFGERNIINYGYPYVQTEPFNDILTKTIDLFKNNETLTPGLVLPEFPVELAGENNSTVLGENNSTVGENNSTVPVENNSTVLGENNSTVGTDANVTAPDANVTVPSEVVTPELNTTVTPPVAPITTTPDANATTPTPTTPVVPSKENNYGLDSEYDDESVKAIKSMYEDEMKSRKSGNKKKSVKDMIDGYFKDNNITATPEVFERIKGALLQYSSGVKKDIEEANKKNGAKNEKGNTVPKNKNRKQIVAEAKKKIEENRKLISQSRKRVKEGRDSYESDIKAINRRFKTAEKRLLKLRNSKVINNKTYNANRANIVKRKKTALAEAKSKFDRLEGAEKDKLSTYKDDNTRLEKVTKPTANEKKIAELRIKDAERRAKVAETKKRLKKNNPELTEEQISGIANGDITLTQVKNDIRNSNKSNKNKLSQGSKVSGKKLMTMINNQYGNKNFPDTKTSQKFNAVVSSANDAFSNFRAEDFLAFLGTKKGREMTTPHNWTIFSGTNSLDGKDSDFIETKFSIDVAATKLKNELFSYLDRQGKTRTNANSNEKKIEKDESLSNLTDGI